MHHRFPLRVAIAGFALLLSALPGRGAPDAPRIVFAETSHDFGEVEEGVELHQVFRFHNAGGGLLEAKGGCSCSLVQVSAIDDEASGGEWIQGPVHLGPGQEGEALVTLKPLGFGRWSKVVTVASNDLSQPKVRLRLSATIRSRFTVEPRVLELGSLAVGSDTVLVVSITPRHPECFRPLGAEVNPPPLADPLAEDNRREPVSGRASAPFTVALRPPAAVPERPDAPWQLEIRLAPAATPGPLNERIRVLTGDPVVPTLEVAVLGELSGALGFPASLEIASPFAGVAASGRVPIRRLSGPPFQILGASANDPYLRIEVLTVTAGEAYDIEITLLPDMPPGLHRPRLIVETDRPDQPQLAIDLLVRMGRGDRLRTGG